MSEDATTYEEHPDDKKLREESEVQAAKVFPKWAEAHRKEIEALVLTYADTEAMRLLEILRRSSGAVALSFRSDQVWDSCLRRGVGIQQWTRGDRRA